MATTTRQLIRESQAGFIAGLRASQLSSYPFKQYKLLQRFEDWCEANPAACMRHFWIRSNADEEVLAGDQISEEIQNTIEVVVAYPLDNRFGLDGVQGLQDVIDQDYRKIDSVVGFKGYGNYIAGHNLCQLESSTVDEGENVWFLRMTYLINYRQSVNLGVQQIIARITGLATVSCSARKVSAIAASITGSASMSARLAYSTSAAITGSGSMTCAIASGPNQLLSFDLSTTNPATSWTSGRTGFSSAYATDEWLMQDYATGSSYSNNVGSETLGNSGGLTDQPAYGIFDGTNYTNREAWESGATAANTDNLIASGTSAGDCNNEDFCIRFVFRMGQAQEGVNYLVAKRSTSFPYPGWNLITNSTNQLRVVVTDPSNNAANVTTGSATFDDGAWHYATAWYDYSADMLYIKTDLTTETSASTAAVTGSLTSSAALVVNSFAGGGSNLGQAGLQVAYVGVCIGANAQSMYNETFWQHASDPTSLLTTATRNCAITVPVAGDGTVATFGVDQLAIGKPSALTTGYALALNDNSTNLLAYSEDFSTWTAGSCTVTDNDSTSPVGFQNASRLAATANNGSVNLTSATGLSNSTTYCFSFWVKRGIGTDVGYNVVCWDVGNAGFLTVTGGTGTATSAWQRVECTVTTAASGTTALAPYIRVNTSGEELLVYGAQLELGSTAGHYIRTNGASASLTYPDYDIVGTAGQYCKAATGEMRVIVIAQKAANGFEYFAGADNGTNLANARGIRMGSDGNLDGVGFDSSGSACFSIEYAISAGVEYDAVMRWDSGGGLALGGGEEAQLVVGGTSRDTEVGTFTSSEDLTRIKIGDFRGGASTSAIHGWLQTLQIWDGEGGYTP